MQRVINLNLIREELYVFLEKEIS